jgi:hypothetical protein
MTGPDMTPLPTSPANSAPMPSASAPQSLLPTETAPGGGRALATAFVEQLSKLLRAAAPTTQPPPVEVSGITPGPAPAAPVLPVTSAIAGSQPQLIQPALPIIELPAKSAETQPVQTRGLGGIKSKADSAAPKGRSGAAADLPAAATVVALPGPDVLAPPPVPPPVARDGTQQHGPARDQHTDQSTNGADQAVGSVSRLDAPAPCAMEPDRPQTQDASVQLVPAQPPAEAVATVMQSAAPQPSVPSVRSAETTATPTSLSAPTTHSGSPAAQLTPALMQMGHAPDGAQRLTVRLDPPELGHVQIKIDRPSDAAARVEITVEKQDTLNLLLRDQPQLQRTLDQAGVPTDGRTVTFHVAAPAPSERTETGTTPVPGTAAGGLAGDLSHGAARQNGQPARQRRDTTDEDGADFAPIAAGGWLRAGLDITA